MVTYLYEYSRLVIAYYIAHKSNEFYKFNEYMSIMEKHLSTKIKCVRTDDGGEFINKRFADVCRSADIVHKAKVPYCRSRIEWLKDSTER